MSVLGENEIVPGVPYSEFVRAAQECRTEEQFRGSPFFTKHGTALEHLLRTPQIALYPNPRPSEHPHDRLRVVHWNIEKGKQLARIVHRLTSDPILRDADVYSFNEVDVGMARSGSNAHVPQVLADALGCHYAFVPSYLECTKGPNEEALAPGENARGWHGLAILSRLPIEGARAIPLPDCFDYFDFFEKRFGGRQALAVRLSWRGRPVEIITTHLEVRNTPQCRAHQMQVLLESLDDRTSLQPGRVPDREEKSVVRGSWQGGRAGRAEAVPRVIAGDFNTNSFRRGSLARSLREFARIVTSSKEALDLELREPYRREPLFGFLRDHRFEFRELSDTGPTAEQLLGSAEDLDLLPKPIRTSLARTFGLGTRVLRMRLDWIATQGWTPLGVGTHSAATPDGPASDHALIHADLRLT